MQAFETAPKAKGRKLAYLLLRDPQAKDAWSGEPRLGLKKEPEDPGPLAGPGFRLRRPRADEEYLAATRKETWIDLKQVIDASRRLQMLPTAEDFHAGLIVAEDWERRFLVEALPLEDLKNDDQRGRWSARLHAIQRAEHYRQLAKVALQIGPLTPGLEGGSLRQGSVELQRYGSDFGLSSKAPDGTVLLWRLAPESQP